MGNVRSCNVNRLPTKQELPEILECYEMQGFLHSSVYFVCMKLRWSNFPIAQELYESSRTAQDNKILVYGYDGSEGLV